MRGCESSSSKRFSFSLLTHLLNVPCDRRWDDGIILPSDTRTVLGLALGVVTKAWRPEEREKVGNFGVFRM